MKEPDSLDSLLHEWKAPEPPQELDGRVTSAYRSAIRSEGGWKRLWTLRVSVPVPVLLGVAIAMFALLLWLRPAASPVAMPTASPGGFQPLPNGDARVVPVAEVQP
jgi:hypothetical protein